MPRSLTLFSGTSVGNNRHSGRCSEIVAAFARRFWPSKTAANLAGRAEVTVRAAERWLEGQNDMSADALANLLRSDVGYPVLCELMQGSTTSWWKDFVRGVRLADLDRKIEIQKREIESLKSEVIW